MRTTASSWSSGCGTFSAPRCFAWRWPTCWRRLPVMQVSDRLTDVAELIVERAMQLAWQQLTPQLGMPMCGAGRSAPAGATSASIGYGKLGGMELGYSSDLDLVFLHDSQRRAAGDRGARSRSTTRCSSCASRSAWCTC